MNILFSYPSYRFTDSNRGVGGEERIAWETISRLARRGHKCYIIGPKISLSKEYENIYSFEIPGCNYRTERNKGLKRVKVIRFSIFSRILAKKLLRKHDIDILHHLLPSYPGFFSSTGDLFSPFIYGPATTKYSSIYEDGKSKLYFIGLIYESIKNILWKKTLKHADKILLEVKYAASWIPEKYHNKIQTLYSGIDTTKFNFTDNKNKNIVLYLNAVRKNKGADVLLNAIPEVIKENRDVTFVFVGRIFEEIYFYQLIKDLKIEKYVKMIGSVPYNEVINYYKNASLYCLPSLQDNAPLSILEAMASGLPVVSTHVMGIPEVVTHMENGLLVKAGDSKELAGAITTLLNNKELRNRMAKNNRKKMVDYFDWARHIDELEEIYKEVSCIRK